MKKGQFNIWMGVAVLLLAGMASCEDEWDRQAAGKGEGDAVTVTLRIGLADEEDGSLPSTRSAERDGGAFGIETGVVSTRAVPVLKPDKLYNLEVGQFDLSGKYMAKVTVANSSTGITIGDKVTLTGLQAAPGGCQLVVVARGSGGTVATLPATSKTTLDSVCALSVEAEKINALNPADQTDMNKMPYVLHVKNVIINSNGVISSREGGTEDVRLKLRRLAVRLNISWNYEVADYNLTRVLVQDVPRNYNLLPKPEADGSYPSLVGQFTSYMVPNASVSARNSYSYWMPANVRGKKPEITSVTMRSGSIAPDGSTYLYFTAVNTSAPSKKLNYRVYLGGQDVTDFSLYDNTDYNYTVNFKHTSLPVDDERVEIISPVPASENNNNEIPTANCLLVTPGSAFCFDPYAYRQNGTDIENTLLTGWAKEEGGIASVKLLWQTKENGDVGDPVVGVVNSETDHTNIVEVKFRDGTDVSAASPLKEKGKGLIYCRVANTKGGNGVIAAYNVSGEILWSWHLWITEYSPDPTGDETVLTENKQKHKYIRSGRDAQLPMMDRNLGAMAGYSTVPEREIDRSKANGFMYQWGRKDPFRSSYTEEVIGSIPIGSSVDVPLKGILSCYGSDGMTFFPMKKPNIAATYREAYKDVNTVFKVPNQQGWVSPVPTDYSTAWGMGTNKGIHDPCPAGWRVCAQVNFFSLFSSYNSSKLEGTLDQVSGRDAKADGGFLLIYEEDLTKYEEGKGPTKTTYYRLPGYWYDNRYGDIGTFGYYWSSTTAQNLNASGQNPFPLRLRTYGEPVNTAGGASEYAALLIRCIQEKEN